MLLAYPKIEADTNWLHDCLQEILVKIHGAIKAGEEPPSWPGVIPNHYRRGLQSRRSLRNRLAIYAGVAQTLSETEHDQLLSALSAQNQIEELLADEAECERLGALPAAIRKPLRDLYQVAFGLLRELDVRDMYEERLIAAHKTTMCPFCGCEYFEPNGARADLDHYLAHTLYPYASANLENLVPMGKLCNQGFKGQVDLLYEGSRRRIAYFPFGEDVATVDLDDSNPLGEDRRPKWVVKLVPGDGRTETWDCVFQIKQRYAAILRAEYDNFLREFKEYCCFRVDPPAHAAELVRALENYIEVQRRYELRDRSFLKAAAFKMLHKHCREGNDDLVELLLTVMQQ